MRIAVDVRSLMEGRQSGVEEYTIQLIKALLKVAPEHEYCLFYNSWCKVELPDFESRVDVSGFRYPNKVFNLLQFLFGWPKWDKLVQADVFFVPNVRLLPLTDGVPFVVTAHDLSFERFPEFYSWRRRLWHKLMGPRRMMRKAAAVIAVSRATKDDVVTIYGVEQGDVKVIHSGVSAKSSSQTNDERIDSLPKSFVLCLGTQEPRKNIPSVIEAYSAIADQVEHDLVLAGSSGWLTGEIDKAYQASEFQNRIHRIGFVEEEIKWWLYKKADVFVYPSFYEGFGFPPLEALLMGTPVITSNNSALPEVVGEWATLVDPYDVTELSLVMRELLSDVSGIEENDMRNIRERYDWSVVARETVQVIENCVKT